MNSATYTLRREIRRETPFDLVVAGGGPAGAAAAIQAGRLGARVLLAEGTGALGGMGTSALVSQWSNIANGVSMVVGGLPEEWLKALHAGGHLQPGRGRPEYWQKETGGIGFHPEALKRLLDRQCLDAGVDLRFFTKLVDVDACAERAVKNGAEWLICENGRTDDAVASLEHGSEAFAELRSRVGGLSDSQ